VRILPDMSFAASRRTCITHVQSAIRPFRQIYRHYGMEFRVNVPVLFGYGIAEEYGRGRQLRKSGKLEPREAENQHPQNLVLFSDSVRTFRPIESMDVPGIV
jgi:hypothetical protein